MKLKTILALDPSSTRTGYAVLNEQEKLLEAGILKPRKEKDPPRERIEAITGDLWRLLEETNPQAIILEWTSGKVGRRRHHGGGAGLAIYGVAIGAIWQMAEFWSRIDRGHPLVELVPENEWTGGRPKGERAAAIGRLYPQYQADRDPGGDIADAIGLGRWWIREHRLRLYADNA